MNRLYENATIIEKANVYFDGRVNSRTVIKENGDKVTLGFMLEGDYEFNTNDKELMEVINGEMDIIIAGESEWKSYSAGTSFFVPENSSFKVRVKKFSDYCCSYLKM